LEEDEKIKPVKQNTVEVVEAQRGSRETERLSHKRSAEVVTFK